MAANNGSSSAQFDLAALYNDGSGGMSMNKSQACQHCASLSHSPDRRLSQTIGYCYQTGIGGKRDENRAIDYYTKAAESGSTASQRNLGILFGQSGQPEKAYFWLRVAEAYGDTEKKSLIDIAKEHLTASQLEQQEKEIVA